MSIKLLLIKPRGFCAGVERAIEIVKKAIVKYGKPVYIRHEIVHNQHVVEDLKKQGAIFVKELDEIPNGSVVIFSAHGVSKQVESAAIHFKIIDATCPLVKKVHNQAKRYISDNRELILIGHAGHPEVEGTMGRVNKPIHLIQTITDISLLPLKRDTPIAYITQTTLSVDDTKDIIAALKNYFNDIVGPELSDICYATQNRQMAVKNIAKLVNIMLILGSKNSSNSNRLRDVAEKEGCNASYLINDYQDINLDWFGQGDTIGITAGASAPENLVVDVVQFLKDTLDISSIEEIGMAENVKFSIPKGL